MSLFAHWKLNNLSTLVEDDTGNGNTLTNTLVEVTTDATYGTVASFDSASQMRLDVSPPEIVGSGPVTFSFWMKLRLVTVSSMIFSQGAGREYRTQWQSNGRFFTFINQVNSFTPVTAIEAAEWGHYVITHSGNTEKVYKQGTLATQRNISINRPSGLFIIGGSDSFSTALRGYLTDFRIYDGALSASEISTLHTEGPSIHIIVPLTVTPRVSSVLSTLEVVDGATGYRLTSQQTGSTVETTVADNFTDLEQSIRNLVPETEYTIRLYSTTDGSAYTLVETLVTTTLPNLGANYDKFEYLSNGRFDIRTDEVVSDVLNDVFATGDPMTVNVSGRAKKSTFVNRGGVVDVSDTESVVAPFSTGGGAGQTMSMILSDATSVVVSYDETTESVTVGSASYDKRDSFILDGKKVTIVDI